MITEQIGKSEKYADIKQVISIVITENLLWEFTHLCHTPERAELKHKNQSAAISSSPGMSKEKTTEN